MTKYKVREDGIIYILTLIINKMMNQEKKTKMTNSSTEETSQKKFSFNTIDNFDSHIEQSIMGYDNLQDIILSLSSNFIKNNSAVIDIGCSTGALLKRVLNYHKEQNPRLIGYDNSALLPACGDILFVDDDVTSDSWSPSGFDLAYSIFTLQFLNPQKRQRLLSKIFMGLNWGGALIVAEKTYCKRGKAQDFFTFAHYDMKARSFKAQEIFDKQRDLRPIMHPQYESNLIAEFKTAGFKAKNIELIWGTLQFKAWLLIK